MERKNWVVHLGIITPRGRVNYELSLIDKESPFVGNQCGFLEINAVSSKEVNFVALVIFSEAGRLSPYVCYR